MSKGWDLISVLQNIEAKQKDNDRIKREYDMSMENNVINTDKSTKKASAMKKIVVYGDLCQACGICINMTDLLEEDSEGKAVPIAPGLINEGQAEAFQEVIESCPAYAIYLEDDEITNQSGTEKMIKLKDYIEEELRSFKVPRPKPKDYKFNKEDYVVKINIESTSAGGFRSESSAESEGMSYFRNAAYSQRPTMIQSVIIQFKTKVLKKYAYYEKEAGNYYYDINTELSKKLSEAEIMARAITNNNINLPSDFTQFEVGPGCGYDLSCCREMRELEKYLHPEGVNSAGEYSCYIKTSGYGNDYSYDISRAVKKFEEHIVLEVKWGYNSDIVKCAVDRYIAEVNKLLSSKIEIIMRELKDNFIAEVFEENVEEKINKELLGVIEEIKAFKLEKAHTNYWVNQDSSMNFSDKYRSRSSCREAAYRLIREYVDDSKGHFSENYGENIAELSAKEYGNQFLKVLNESRKKIQRVYDKYNEKYPEVVIELSEFGNHRDEKLSIRFNLSSTDELSLNQMNYEVFYPLRNSLENQLGKFNEYRDMICYNSDMIEILDLIDYKEGWFGRDIEVHEYEYQIYDGKVLEQFIKAREKYEEDLYQGEYINKTFNKMIELLTNEIERKLIK